MGAKIVSVDGKKADPKTLVRPIWLADGIEVIDRVTHKRAVLASCGCGLWTITADAERWIAQTEAWVIEHWEPRPTRGMVADDAWYERLDSGIRFAVRVLHAAGIETCQSCEGGDGHAYDRPTIDLPAGNDADGFKALGALASYGLDVEDIAILWPVVRGMPIERIWRITFRTAYHDRADERPGFVYGVMV